MREFRDLVKRDLIAYDSGLSMESAGIKDFIYRYIKTPGFKVTYAMRLCKYLERKKWLKIIYLIERFRYRQLQVKYGIQIGHRLDIRGGGYRLLTMVGL